MIKEEVAATKQQNLISLPRDARTKKKQDIQGERDNVSPIGNDGTNRHKEESRGMGSNTIWEQEHHLQADDLDQLQEQETTPEAVDEE